MTIVLPSIVLCNTLFYTYNDNHIAKTVYGRIEYFITFGRQQITLFLFVIIISYFLIINEIGYHICNTNNLTNNGLKYIFV